MFDQLFDELVVEAFENLNAIAEPALSREDVIDQWQENIDSAIAALRGFRDDLSDWQEQTPTDDEFMTAFRRLVQLGLEGWTDGQPRPTIDELRHVVTSGEGLDAVQRPQDEDEYITAIFD